MRIKSVASPSRLPPSSSEAGSTRCAFAPHGLRNEAPRQPCRVSIDPLSQPVLHEPVCLERPRAAVRQVTQTASPSGLHPAASLPSGARPVNACPSEVRRPPSQSCDHAYVYVFLAGRSARPCLAMATEAATGAGAVGGSLCFHAHIRLPQVLSHGDRSDHLAIPCLSFQARVGCSWLPRAACAARSCLRSTPRCGGSGCLERVPFGTARMQTGSVVRVVVDGTRRFRIYRPHAGQRFSRVKEQCPEALPV